MMIFPDCNDRHISGDSILHADINERFVFYSTKPSKTLYIYSLNYASFVGDFRHTANVMNSPELGEMFFFSLFFTLFFRFCNFFVKTMGFDAYFLVCLLNHS